MKILLFILALCSLLACSSGKNEFVLDNARDTLTLIASNDHEGEFIRKLDVDGIIKTYNGKYWIDGSDYWLFPWHGLAYSEGAFYTTDSAMVNFGVRKNIFGQLRSLYLSDDGIEFRRVND